MKFKIGDQVRYTSNSWGDEYKNPLWGGRYGRIVGTIITKKNGHLGYRVEWGEDRRNSYDEKDLELAQGQLNLFGD